MSEKLTDLKIKSLKPKAKPYTVSDGSIGGLHVAVSPKGKKVFRLAYNFQGKAQLLRRRGTIPSRHPCFFAVYSP